MRRSLIFSVFLTVLGFVIISCQAGGQTSKPTVIVASPPSESVYTVGEKVVVQSTSTDPVGVTRVALLVDGSVVRDDPSPVAQGQAQFSLLQSWTAAGTGQHTITVRATNSQGAMAESGILVHVQDQSGLQPTTIIAIATAVPISSSTPVATSAPATEKVVVTATPPATDESATSEPPCTDNSKFVADLTIPDGTIFTPGAVFTKSWRVLNAGACPWENYSLVFVSGAQLATNGIFPVPSTAPGATADLTVPMAAPANYGAYTGIWRLRDAAGQLFGTNLTVVIKVPAPATSAPPTQTPLPTRLPGGCSGQPSDFNFSTTATTINPGQSVTLSWSAVTNATEVRLDGGEFSNEGVETPGSRTVSPSGTTTYVLTAKCSNGGKIRVKSITITVNGSPLADFGGSWDHNFGSMVIAQSGANVNGSYNTGIGVSGTFAGTVTANTFSGTWQSGGNSGSVKFVMGGNNKTFTGNWNDTNQWCGARTGESFPGGCAFDGNWNTKYDAGTPCAMSLNQIGAQVSGTYCNGTMSGTISYAPGYLILSGTWVSTPPGGPFVFYMPLFSSSQFQGDYNTTHAWCGWRSNSSAPNPCLK